MPGISKTAIGIPFRRGGVNWVAYWATRFPSLLILTINTDTQVTLDWTNNGVADYDDIRIERGIDGVTYVEIDDIPLGSNTYADGGLTPQTYYWRIRYRNGANYSAYSNVVTTTEDGFYAALNSIITEADEAILTEIDNYLIQE